MGKGGRGHGGHGGHGHFGGGRHFGSGQHFGGGHHRHHYSSGSGGGVGAQAYFDLLHDSIVPPSLINGIYSFTGSEMSFRSQLQQPINLLLNQGMQQQQQQSQLNMLMMGGNMLPAKPNPSQIEMNTQGQQQPSIQQINITLVGNKIKPTNNCCLMATVFFGSFCIFPLCFMCCMWWKKIVFPMCELSVQAYRDIGAFIEKNPTANNLNLTVIDSSFNSQKAKILFDFLSRSHITALTFINQALECNGNFNEADDFKANMLPIKSLSISSSITWGDMIV